MQRKPALIILNRYSTAMKKIKTYETEKEWYIIWFVFNDSVSIIDLFLDKPLKQHKWAFGLVVWFSLRVREVPSSILGMPQFTQEIFHFFPPVHARLLGQLFMFSPYKNTWTTSRLVGQSFVFLLLFKIKFIYA